MRLVTTTEYGEFDPWIEALGFVYAYGEDGTPYWAPECSIELSEAEVQSVMRAAAQALERLMDTVSVSFAREGAGFPQALGFDDEVAQRIHRSWAAGERSLHGRFDFGVGAQGEVRLFEYNADPLSMHCESTVVQARWLEVMKAWGRLPERASQCNALVEALVEALGRQGPQDQGRPALHVLYQHRNFGRVCNARVLAKAARSAGLKVHLTDADGVTLDRRGVLCDVHGEPIEQAINLVAWSWLDRLRHGCTAPVRWFDPEWTRVLGHKGLLVRAWQWHSDCPVFLPAAPASQWSSLATEQPCVVKPVIGLEGGGVHFFEPAFDGCPAVRDAGWIVQQAFESRVESRFVTVSVWVVDGRPVRSLGVRGSKLPVNDERSNFFPHYVLD